MSSQHHAQTSKLYSSARCSDAGCNSFHEILQIVGSNLHTGSGRTNGIAKQVPYVAAETVRNTDEMLSPSGH